MFNIFKRNKASFSDRADGFWQWFRENEATLADLFPRDPERVVNMVGKELDKVHQLAFEFGPGANGKKEFFISADGIKVDFPKVALLCKAAPELQQWIVVPFRQRKELLGNLGMHGMSMNLEDCAFQLSSSDSGLTDMVMYIKGMTEETFEIYASAGFVILDTILGEFDVSMKIGAIDFEPLTDNLLSKEGVIPVNGLREAFDRMHASDGKPVIGEWTGYYQYEGMEDKKLPVRARINGSGPYLSGSMEDDSDLGEATINGYFKGASLIFEKSYDRDDVDPVTYFGKIDGDGKTMTGQWKLESRQQLLEGTWMLERS